MGVLERGSGKYLWVGAKEVVVGGRSGMGVDL